MQEMPKKPNAVCAICGQKYYVCNACKHTKDLSSWRIIADTADCYKIYMIVHHYTNGSITKETAQKQLEQCSLPKTFQPHIQAVIDEVTLAADVPKDAPKNNKEKE